MSPAEEIYQAVLDAPDTQAAIASLSLCHWRMLYGHLLRTYDENGVSGEILGRMMVEGAARLHRGGNES